MYRHGFLKIILLFIILVSIGILFFIGEQISDQSIVSTQNKEKHPNPISIQGIKFQRSKGNQITAKAFAQELKVNPRKFFIFNIKPFNELTLNNVTIEFYKNEEESSDIDLKDLMDKLLPISSAKSSFSKKDIFGATGTGLITRAIINGLILKIYNNNNLSLIIRSAKAYLNLKKSEVIFRNAVVDDITSKEIINSRKIVFKSGENVLWVPGQYVLMSPTGSKKGNGLKIDL